MADLGSLQPEKQDVKSIETFPIVFVEIQIAIRLDSSQPSIWVHACVRALR